MVQVEEMRASVLEKRTLDREELDSRVKELVESHSLQVARWSLKDSTAALGIHDDALIKGNDDVVPFRTVHQLVHNTIVRTLEAKLNESSLTPEEREAITLRLTPKSKLDEDAHDRYYADKRWSRRAADVPPRHATADAQP